MKTTKKGRVEDNNIIIGDVYLMRFDGVGSEQRGVRPGVVFQNNIGNAYSPNVIALPLTTSLKQSKQPTHVFLDADKYGLPYDSMVLCENPQRMSRDRILKKVTSLDDEALRSIAVANALASASIGFLSYHELMRTWKKARKLNGIDS